ncbi:MAG: hypothetical protein NVS3B26_06250 [Mycobacteriales bacterium]
MQVAVDQGWLVQYVVTATRLPRAVEKADDDRAITPEECAQIRLQLTGEGNRLLCDRALDCGLRYEEVIALRPMDRRDADAGNAPHLWTRQAITWPGRAYTRGDDPWLVGPTKGQRLRKVAVSGQVFDRLGLYITAHGRKPRSLVFDYPLLRAEHLQAREARPAPVRFPAGRYVSPATDRSGEHGKDHTYTLGCAARTAAPPTPRPGPGPVLPRAPNRLRHGWTRFTCRPGRVHRPGDVPLVQPVRVRSRGPPSRARLEPDVPRSAARMVSWSYDAEPLGRLPKWLSSSCRHRAWEAKRVADRGLVVCRTIAVEVPLPVVQRLEVSTHPRGAGWALCLHELAKQLDTGRTYDRDLPALLDAAEALLASLSRRPAAPGLRRRP